MYALNGILKKIVNIKMLNKLYILNKYQDMINTIR